MSWTRGQSFERLHQQIIILIIVTVFFKIYKLISSSFYIAQYHLIFYTTKDKIKLTLQILF